MKNFLMWDEESGEEFIVEATTEDEALTKAREYFDEPYINDEISDFEAEMLGYDTY